MRAEAGRFARFIVVGGVNTLVTYGLYLALLPLLHHQAAYALTYVLGIGLQYVMHSRFVFPQKMTWRGLLGYPAIHLILYGVGVTLLYLLVDAGGFSARLAPIVVIGCNIPLGFLLTRTWMLRRAAIAAGHVPPPLTVAQRVDLAIAWLVGAAAGVFALGAVAFVLAYGWREPMADQYRQYLPLMTQSFPANLFALENGHRPIFPNVLRLVDLAFGGQQVVLIVSGLLFALGTAGLVVFAAWRDARLTWATRAAVALLAVIALFWLGNARMLMHGNESCQIYLAAFAMAAAGWLAWLAVHLARPWPMLAAVACAIVATFSFGSGIAAFPAVIVLAIAMRAPGRLVLVPVSGFAATLALYLVVLPGSGGVGGAIHVHPVANAGIATRWLAGPWINAWLGLGDAPGGAWLHDQSALHRFGAIVVGSADALMRAIGTDAIRGELALAIGAAGIAVVAALAIRRALRREPWPLLAAVALALALFGAATAAVISLVRHDYFAQNTAQIFAERYALWPSLFWLGAALLVVDAIVPARRAWTPAAIAAIALVAGAIAWPTHLAWRGWGATVDLRAETLAAGYRLGVVDPPWQPSPEDASPEVIARTLDAMRARHVAVFATPGHEFLERVLAPEPLPAVAPATVTLDGAFVDAATQRRVVRLSGAVHHVRDRRRSDLLLVLDADHRVVGLANWAPSPTRPAAVTWPHRVRTGITGYAFAPADCAPLTMALWHRAKVPTVRAIATVPSCAAAGP